MSGARPKPFLQTVDGILFPGLFSPDNIKDALQYQAKPEDVFIVTYPKCGTTWMQNVAINIFRKGKELEDPKDFPAMSPFIEARGRKFMDDMPRPGAFKTHLPFDRIPYSPDAKYIIVLRNPKDCCVSFFYHCRDNVSFAYWDATFDDFFEIFMEGEVEYGDYFDHVLSWYAHRNDKNVFFTTYEEMKKDLKNVILKLSEFLGAEYIAAIRSDDAVLQNILKFSSFEYMKKNIGSVYNSSKLVLNVLKEPRFPEEYKKEVEKKILEESLIQKEFFRKGKTGDWTNYFSEEQSIRLNQKFLGKLQGTEIVDMYRDYF